MRYKLFIVIIFFNAKLLAQFELMSSKLLTSSHYEDIKTIYQFHDELSIMHVNNDISLRSELYIKNKNRTDTLYTILADSIDFYRCLSSDELLLFLHSPQKSSSCIFYFGNGKWKKVFYHYNLYNLETDEKYDIVPIVSGRNVVFHLHENLKGITHIGVLADGVLYFTEYYINEIKQYYSLLYEDF